MSSNFSKVCFSLAALFASLCANLSLGQEQETAENAPESPSMLRIRYLEVPVAVEPGVDPQMPALPEPELDLEPEDDPEFIRRMSSIREYTATVESLEQAGGAWDAGLVEQLASIAELEQQQGNHPGAIQAYDRAIHINRISNGLHTLDQIPQVEGMIDSYLAIGNWEQADLYNNYLFFVQQKAFGADDPRIIPVLDRLASWHMRAFNIGYGESLGVRLSSAQMLFRAAVRMVGKHFGRQDERFERYLRNLAISGYQASRYPHYSLEVDRAEFRADQELLRDLLNEQGSVVPQGFGIGEAALRDIVAYYQENSEEPYDTAEVITHLADWYLLFDRRRLAQEYYTRAWEILAAEENGEELIQKLFGQVVPIPTYANEPKNLAIRSSLSRTRASLNYAYADILVDVTASGATRNIQILTEETAENAQMLSSLQREVRTTKFRPLLEEGQLVRSGGHQFRYRYWY
ncbi:MAG: hypothetical protein OXU66_09490 [Gammaproteobacteria bacterium]|nr:hypothetical protein [Gammaproteobacteria bacterium]MDD9959164.1 hypothetical protein [Gammaproteobacteria bacterium]